jgi:hypothetical protein
MRRRWSKVMFAVTAFGYRELSLHQYETRRRHCGYDVRYSKSTQRAGHLTGSAIRANPCGS